MSALRCATCGHVTKPARVKARVQLQPADVDTRALSEADARAYFKATAPEADARFFLQGNSLLTADMRAEIETLISERPARAEFYRRLTRVQDGWRALALARARDERIADAALAAALDAEIDAALATTPAAADTEAA